MELGNKGFAISTILYGMILMATMILFLLVSNLSFSKKSTDDFTAQIEKELNACVEDKSC